MTFKGKLFWANKNTTFFIWLIRLLIKKNNETGQSTFKNVTNIKASNLTLPKSVHYIPVIVEIYMSSFVLEIQAGIINLQCTHIARQFIDLHVHMYAIFKNVYTFYQRPWFGL